jgi:uncharacterized membrane protein
MEVLLLNPGVAGSSPAEGADLEGKFQITMDFVMSNPKTVLLYVMTLFYIANGVNHFLNQGAYLKIMPPYIPFHRPMVILSGIAEIFLGAMLLVTSLTQFASWGIILLLILIFTANLHMAFNNELYSNFHPLTLYLRLPLQFVLIAWAFWYTKAN